MSTYECSKCSKGYQQKGHYENHIAKCADLICCEHLFTRQENLDRHREKVHQQKSICPCCDRPFRKEHMRRHEQNCIRLHVKRGIKGKRPHGEIPINVQQANPQAPTGGLPLQWIDYSDKPGQTSAPDQNGSTGHPRSLSPHHLVSQRTQASLIRQVSKSAVSGDLQSLRDGVEELLNRGCSLDSITRSRAYLDGLLVSEVAAYWHTGLVKYLQGKGCSGYRHFDLISHNRVELLHGAVLRDRADIVGVALDGGVAVDVCNARGDSLLCSAASGRALDCIELLLSRGASVNGHSHDRTPLLLACEGFYSNPLSWTLTTLKYLFKAGADPNYGSPLPLEYAAKEQLLLIIPKILEAGANQDLLPEPTRRDLEQLLKGPAFLKVNEAYQHGADTLAKQLSYAIEFSPWNALIFLDIITWYDSSLKTFNLMFEDTMACSTLGLAAVHQRRELIHYLLRFEQDEIDPDTVKFPWYIEQHTNAREAGSF
ncbi:hypothetical protein EJ03DRAFT_192658 [Teratosphaeria nubilosa]|uniref:Uncharacterized protein n=1 Tax=Teratosphaeria nubilosa TaxID=161662 RepID=A0A6G1L0K6_9PEZI|nr:hypothetical protein EJ03DRAFT_192658 [Teratosphaeria nubilosa]